MVYFPVKHSCLYNKELYKQTELYSYSYTVFPRLSAGALISNFKKPEVIPPFLPSYIHSDSFLRRGVGLYFKFHDSMGAFIQEGELNRGNY